MSVSRLKVSRYASPVMQMAGKVSLSALVLGLAACSPDVSAPAATPASTGTQTPTTTAPAVTSAPARTQTPTATAPAASPAPTATQTPTATAPGAKVLGLEGLGALKIGQPVPTGTTWAERGAQASDTCRTVSSPDYAGVYGIVLDGKVQRITVSKRSDVKLEEGIGPGAPESDVQKWFAGFAAEPHKYEDPPAKYLTAPNAANGSSALRFEIGSNGLVTFMHVGTMPALGYVEGCS